MRENAMTFDPSEDYDVTATTVAIEGDCDGYAYRAYAHTNAEGCDYDEAGSNITETLTGQTVYTMENVHSKTYGSPYRFDVVWEGRPPPAICRENIREHIGTELGEKFKQIAIETYESITSLSEI